MNVGDIVTDRAFRMPTVSLNRLGLALLCLSLSFLFVVMIEPAPSDLFFVFAFVALLATGSVKIDHSLRPFFVALLLFFFANIISALSWKSFSFGARYLAITVYMLLIPLVMAHLASVFGRPAVDSLYRAIFIAAGISSVIGFLAAVGIAPGPSTLYFRNDYGPRLSPLFKDPNVFGPFMTTVATLLIGYSMRPTSRKKVRSLLLALFMLFVMFLTFSRGAWFGTAFSGVVFFLLMLSFVRERRSATTFLLFSSIGSLIALGGGIYMLTKLGLNSFLAHRFALQSYDSKRFSNWSQAFEVISERPFGVGPGHYVGRAVFSQSEFNIAPHNVYLKVAVENGWLGYLTFFGAITIILIMLFRTMIKSDDRQSLRIAIFSALLGQLTNSIVVDSLHWRHLFVLIGFACCELILFRISVSRLEKPRNAAKPVT